MDTQHKERILALPTLERYNYLIGKAVDTGKLWVVQNEEGDIQSMRINEVVESIPVWPEKVFAEALLEEKWANYTAESIALEDFVATLDAIAKENLKIAVFPLPNLLAIAFDPLELKDHLTGALKNAE